MGDEVRPHYNLDAWKEAMALVNAVYRVTQAFPKEELYGLSSQMRRAAVSVPSNLAEGAAPSPERESPRLCRGGSQSLTVAGVHR
jgi:four helix bundle protein